MLDIADFLNPYSKTGKIESFLFLPIGFSLLVGTRTSVSAQVVPDNTLPSNSIVTPNGNTIDITGGTTAGNNLFHSFEQFSVQTGQTAYFNNNAQINNIISRVTGGSISNIDGLIRANGSANLFLINPNGIIFGANASLDIGGSFIGSTANSLRFADGSEFSATNPQAPPLLEINVPVGLQYGANAGGITVQGSGNNLSVEPQTFAIIQDNRPVGLQVQPGQTLALIGGPVSIEGGNLTAPGGRVELGSVSTEGVVQLTPTNPGWKLSYDVQNFQDIELSQAASVDTSGNGGGDIHVQGRRVSLADGSAMLANTLGSAAGGDLTVSASESVEVTGTSALLPFFSGLFADVAPGATGDGGKVTIETARLLVSDGAQIGANTFGDGDADGLTVKATEVELIGSSPLGPSGLFAIVAPGATGNGGNITLNTSRLLIADGARGAITTFGSSNAGALQVRANEIELIGTSPGGNSSGLFSIVEPEATGTGGNLLVEADRLQISNGAQISVSTFGLGDAGILEVIATEVEIISGSPLGPSGLLASVAPGATGNGGQLIVNTDRLRVTDGGQIAVGTAGLGNAGELSINASESIELIGASEQGASGLFASAVFDTGNGGNIKLNTSRLIILDGATINTSNFSTNPEIPPGQGRAGDIEIQANSLTLDRQSNITAATDFGGGGNIKVYVEESLIARDRSTISAQTFGIGDGGKIDIVADSLSVASGSEIVTDSEGAGQAGDITISADRINLNQGNIGAISKQTGGGDINLASEFILLENGSTVSTSVLDSTGGGGNINIDTDLFVEIENSEISADAVLGAGGNIQITTQGLFLSPDSEISASSQFGIDGTVEITDPNVNRTSSVAKLPETVTDPTQLVASSCTANRENVFAVTGKGGLPEDPSQTLRGETYWVDMRSLERNRMENVQESPVESVPLSHSQDEIVEAKGWTTDADGTLLLVAEPVDPLLNPSGQQKTQCGGQANL